MGPPSILIVHPPESRLPGIMKWLAEVEDILRSDANWEGCHFERIEYDSQGAFHVGTVADQACRLRAPVILIQKVQTRLLEKLKGLLRRATFVLHVPVGCPEDLLAACEQAQQAYRDGEPRIPLRELIAYLILRKLAKLGRRGGNNQKGFLWGDLLPKGGFPKDVVAPRDIMDVAEQLVRAQVLQVKTSQGTRKFALGDTPIVQPILDSKSFASVLSLQTFFGRDGKVVPARLLDYNDPT